jgi:uncharacterized membrane protein
MRAVAASRPCPIASGSGIAFPENFNPAMVSPPSAARAKRIRAKQVSVVTSFQYALAMLLTFINLWLRFEDPAMVLPAGFLLSILVALALGITGWYGGELSYRYRIGVFGQRSD